MWGWGVWRDGQGWECVDLKGVGNRECVGAELFGVGMGGVTAQGGVGGGCCEAMGMFLSLMAASGLCKEYVSV